MPEPIGWNRRGVLRAGAAAAAVAAGGGLLAACGLGRASSPDREDDQEEGGWSGTLLDPPFEKPDVTFTDVDGRPFPFRTATEGKLTLLFFGYTNCPDVCPVYLNTLARAKEGIGSGPGSRPQVLFVGVDVKRDTPAVMKTYLGNIDPEFIGLTASEDVIATAIKAVHGAPVEIGAPQADGSYLVGHPAQVTVYTKDDLAHRIYPYGVRQAAWTRDLPLLDEGQYR